jgi:GAF domain
VSSPVDRAGAFSLPPHPPGDSIGHPHPRLAELARALMRMPAAGVSMLAGGDCRVPALTLEIPLTDVEDRLSAEIMRTGDAVVVGDLAKPGRRARLTRRGDAGSFAGVPLRGPAGDVIGALWVSDTRPRRLRADQIRLMASLGSDSSAQVAAMSPAGMSTRPPGVDTTSARLVGLLEHADAMIYIKNVQGRSSPTVPCTCSSVWRLVRCSAHWRSICSPLRWRASI